MVLLVIGTIDLGMTLKPYVSTIFCVPVPFGGPHSRVTVLKYDFVEWCTSVIWKSVGIRGAAKCKRVLFLNDKKINYSNIPHPNPYPIPPFALLQLSNLCLRYRLSFLICCLFNFSLA